MGIGANRDNRFTTILCSGFGLGFYNPGLIVNYQLRQRGIPTEVLVFERFMQVEKQAKIVDSRKAYHDNFKLAKIATKLPKDIRDSFDSEQIIDLLNSWAAEGRKRFISLSGHWVYILELYREKLDAAAAELEVDLLYVDSDLSPSWKSLKKYMPDYPARYREVWLYASSTLSIHLQIRVGDEEPLPFADRAPRYVIHGGGWGMGTYQGKIPELAQLGFALDVVAYEPAEAQGQQLGNRYYMNDPEWTAWNKGESGEHEFPRFGEIRPDTAPSFSNLPSHHGLYDVIRQAKGIISKPGAGTLMDSLASATPVIMLEPFGEHEKRNLEVWVEHGLGITYEDWERAGFAEEALATIHERLLAKRAAARTYTDDYLERIGWGEGRYPDRRAT
ncbi:UDP-glucuronosyltransferase [Paenibacillus sp. BIHB 4019]|uniref:UDP-glucuronosyltransferase n=2 Tax=Paenibacillus sp. BIHB 4019 TaxID=1870819 RepID=A0A1B2DR83_9BACL|nr:UDP-glucuronosyltransferase [Paenibacillus sp. BIHB 4019]